ncbi:MAG: hypothetical protein MUP90_04900 [Gammaproteobacteria bacterium]|nr:hypothetical protein [Gammaproteobacteria bacterium]
MYNIKHLFGIARAGLTDMGPAVRQAFNADPDDDHLDQVYGASPRAGIIGLSVLGILVGELLTRFGPDLPVNPYIHWPAVLLGLVFALVIRRYLFAGERARDGVQEQDFPWLAASLAAPLALLMLEFLVSQIVGETSAIPGDTPSHGLFFGEILVMFTHTLGVAAAMTIAVAALCFSKNWGRGLLDLAKRLIVFRVMVYVTTLILLKIGIVGPVISGILHKLFNFSIPQWISEFADQVSYAGVMSVIYLAVIGATWTVCRRSFGELLASGEVDILKTIEELAEDPKAKRKKAEKRKGKERKKALKAAGKDS